MSENVLLVRTFSSKETKFGAANYPFWGNLSAKWKFWAPIFHLSEICSCLSENCNFLPLPQLTLLTHDAAALTADGWQKVRPRPWLPICLLHRPSEFSTSMCFAGETSHFAFVVNFYSRWSDAKRRRRIVSFCLLVKSSSLWYSHRLSCWNSGVVCVDWTNVHVLNTLCCCAAQLA